MDLDITYEQQPKEITEEYISQLIHNVKRHKISNEDILSLLQNPASQRHFKYNIKQFFSLFSRIVNSTKDETFLINLLKNELFLYKTLIIDNAFNVEYFDDFIAALLKTAIRFKKNNDVYFEISRVFQKYLFSKKYKDFIFYIENKSVEEKHQFCQLLFKYLQKLYNSNEIEDCFGFKLVFHAFSHSFHDFSAIYKMFAALVNITGFEVRNELKIELNLPETEINYDLNKSLLILNDLFTVLANSKIETDAKINNITFSDFIKNLLQSIISVSEYPTINSFNIISNVIEIDPLVIEPIIEDIITYSMLADNTEICIEYQNVMIKIFQVFAKLHRIQNFIGKIIVSIKAGLEKRHINEPIYKFCTKTVVNNKKPEIYNIETILPKAILNYFTNCITNLASWQIMNLFKTFLFHLEKAVDELSEKTSEENCKLTFLEILTTLAGWYLCSVRIAEHTVLASSVEKFLGGLDDLRTILGKFGTNLLHREHNHILMRAFLNISYNWGEIYMILAYYSIDPVIKLKKVTDNDFSACNLTYLHSYLTTEQWCLISERITNFGEDPCRNTMRMLCVQKLRANLLFEENIPTDMIISIVKDFTSQTNVSLDILTDKFVVNTVLPKFPPDAILDFAERIVDELINKNTDFLHLFDSSLVTNAILTVICIKLGKLFRLKRKIDENLVSKPVCTKIFACLPSEGFLNTNMADIQTKMVDILINDSENKSELSLPINKILKYFDLFKIVPVIFCEEPVQKIFLLLLFALHKDICSGNNPELKQTAENLILSLIQYNKYDLLDLFPIDYLIRTIIEKFDRSEEFSTHLSANIFKTDESITKFGPGIEFISHNLKNNDYVKFAVAILHQLAKTKRTKLAPSTKDVCNQYKSAICNKLVKILLKKPVESCLIEAFALVLKNEQENSKLKDVLPGYLEFSLQNVTESNLKGVLLLHTTVLRKKSSLDGVSDDFSIRIWNSLQGIGVKSDLVEDFSSLVVLIASSIQNEEFSKIFSDLLRTTEISLDSHNYSDFFNHLKTWTSILTTNFNPIKTKIVHDQLELLMRKLILTSICGKYEETLFDEITKFQVAIIQTNHLPLTSPIIDHFLLTLTILIQKIDENFNHIFNSSMLIMENLLKWRNALIMDRLPPYLQQYRLLLQELCKNSNSNLEKIRNVQELADCAHQFEKLTKNLVNCPKDMSRISLYLIGDILKQYELVTLYPNVKIHLNNCIYSLMSLCDKHAVRFLMRVLSNASTEIFKVMYANYKKYYRFTGKV